MVLCKGVIGVACKVCRLTMVANYRHRINRYSRCVLLDVQLVRASRCCYIIARDVVILFSEFRASQWLSKLHCNFTFTTTSEGHTMTTTHFNQTNCVENHHKNAT